MRRILSAVVRTLPLFADVTPALVLPSPRLAVPRQLTLFPLPAPVRRRLVTSNVDPRQLALLPGLVAPPRRLRLVRGHADQLLLPTAEPARGPDGKRHLSIVPAPLVDLLRASRGLCLYQASECGEGDCRYHLGEPRELDGEVWLCAIDVANHFPRGLSPKAAAALDGGTEGEVQRLEKKLMIRLRKEMQQGQRPDLQQLHDEGYPSDEDDGGMLARLPRKGIAGGNEGD